MFRKKTVVQEPTHAEVAETILEYLKNAAKAYENQPISAQKMIEMEIELFSGTGPLGTSRTH